MVHHHQAVHRRDGRQTVRDGHHRLAFHQPVQAVLDSRFHLAVERAGGFVEQQDRRVFQHHAGDGHALALTTAELDAALSHVGVEARAAFWVGQARDELVGLGTLGGALHLGVAGVGPAVGDVVAHRAVQQRGVLRDHADGTAQALLRHAGDVLAVDQHPAALDVVQAQQQIDHGALAGTRATDQPDLLARADRQRQPVDDLPGAAVAEADVLEAHFAAADDERLGLGLVEHRTRLRQGVDAVLHGTDVLEQRSHLPHHPVRDAVQPHRHRGGRSHGADTDLALRPQPQRRTRRCGDEPDAEDLVDHFEGRHQPHLAVGGDHELLHCAPGEMRLAL